MILLAALVVAPVAAYAEGDAGAATGGSALVALLDEAEQLLGAKRAADCYKLLSAHESEWAGDPRYDYLLGLAALDSAQPQAAIAPFERVLAVEPRFSGARMELGRALYESADLPRARAQFQMLLDDQPLAITRSVIERYLAAIDHRAALTQSRVSASIEMGAGYDSNANGSTSDTEFLGFTLNPRNVEQESSFIEIGGALAHTRPTRADAGLVSSIRLAHRLNPDARYVDQTLVLAGTSYVFNIGQNRASLGVNGYFGWLDGQSHQASGSLELGISRRFADDWEIAGLLRGGVLDFRQPWLDVLDVDRFLGGAALTRYRMGPHAGRFGVAALAGRDVARARGSAYGNSRYGARLFGGMLLRPQGSLYAEVAWIRSDYGGGGGFFGASREDEQLTAVLGVDVQNWPAAGWSFTPQVRYTDNDSNVGLFAYDRLEALLFVRFAVQ